MRAYRFPVHSSSILRVDRLVFGFQCVFCSSFFFLVKFNLFCFVLCCVLCQSTLPHHPCPLFPLPSLPPPPPGSHPSISTSFLGQIPHLDPNDPRVQAAVDQVGAAKKEDEEDKKGEDQSKK